MLPFIIDFLDLKWKINKNANDLLLNTYRYGNQILRSKEMSLELLEKLLEENQDVKAVFIGKVKSINFSL